MLSNYTVRVHSISSRSRSFLCVCVCVCFYLKSLRFKLFTLRSHRSASTWNNCSGFILAWTLSTHDIWLNFQPIERWEKIDLRTNKRRGKTNRNTEHRTQQHKTLTGPKAINGKMENLNLKCGFPPLNTTNIEIVL